MHRILDIKPDHEAVVVRRVETLVRRALQNNFPHLQIAAKNESFGDDESTAITENPLFYQEDKARAAGFVCKRELNHQFPKPPARLQKKFSSKAKLPPIKEHELSFNEPIPFSVSNTKMTVFLLILAFFAVITLIILLLI